MLEIKPYSPEFEEAHIKFASKYWTKGRRKNPEYIYWKFRGKQKKNLPSFLLAVVNGNVVGQLGLIPCKVQIEEAVYEGQWACDLMVDTAYRGKNIAKALYDHAHKSVSITLGSDPSPAASKSMKRYGYKSMKGPWKFIFPLKIGEVTKLKGFNIKVLNFITNPFVFFIKYLLNSDFKVISHEEYLIINHNKFVKKTAYIAQDNDFVNWRYKSFKHYYHEINTFSNSKGSCFSGFYNNSIYYITEFKVDSLIDFFKIIAYLLSVNRDKPLLRIKFFSNYDFISRWLILFGFIKFRTQTEIIFFTEQMISDKLDGSCFYYTLLNSDENI